MAPMKETALESDLQRQQRLLQLQNQVNIWDPYLQTIVDFQFNLEPERRILYNLQSIWIIDRFDWILQKRNSVNIK